MIGVYPRKSGVPLRIADNQTTTHHWCAPTNSASRSDSALRTTPETPTIGAPHEAAVPGDALHSGQLRLHQQAVLSREPRGLRSRKSSRRRSPTWANTGRKWLDRQRLRKPPRELRIANNKSRPHHWCTPTNYRSGPHSALRTTTGAPTMVATHEARIPATLRIADNSWCTNNGAHPQILLWVAA